MDWYRSALKILPERNFVILTDLTGGVVIKINDKDEVYELLIIDNFLFNVNLR